VWVAFFPQLPFKRPLPPFVGPRSEAQKAIGRTEVGITFFFVLLNTCAEASRCCCEVP